MSDTKPTSKLHRAYLLVKCKAGTELDVLTVVRKLKQVTKADIVYGVTDLIIQVEFKEDQDLQQIVYSLIHKIPNIEDTDTCVVSSLSEHK